MGCRICIVVLIHLLNALEKQTHIWKNKRKRQVLRNQISKTAAARLTFNNVSSSRHVNTRHVKGSTATQRPHEKDDLACTGSTHGTTRHTRVFDVCTHVQASFQPPPSARGSYGLCQSLTSTYNVRTSSVTSPAAVAFVAIAGKVVLFFHMHWT